MRLLVNTAMTLAFVTPAIAWDVGHFQDRMTDRQETYATVSSNGADLYVGCLNKQVFPRINFAYRVGFGTIAMTHRFDNEPLSMRGSSLSADGKSVWLWLTDGPQAAAKMQRAKRLRVTIGQQFYDFDLAKGDRLPNIKCKR